MMENVLRKVQMTELETLKVIDEFCQTHGINYSLYAGSLIGAVRHQGFIPWDDDLDICMSRDNYNKFILHWEQNPPKGYVLQNKENSPLFPSSFTKIRKDHTTFLHDEIDRGRFHTGIFVDVFPIDRVPKNILSRMSFYWNYMQYHLLTREYIPPESGFATQMIARIVLKLNKPQKRLQKRQQLLERVTKYNNNSRFDTVGAEIISTMKINLPPDLMDEYTYLQFEDGKFMCFKQWDEYLRRTYGDYMQFPPEEERKWTHHPIIIDFEHNLEEITDETEGTVRFQNQ